MMNTPSLRSRLWGFIVLLFICSLVSCTTDITARPRSWAKPIHGTSLTNLYQVSPDLYRCEQPDSKSFKELKVLGIKSVLNLRDFHKDEDKGAKGTGLMLYRVEINAGAITVNDVIAALKIIRSAPKPILVHCQHGSDRTGCICAMYRIVFQNWTKEEAIDEMTRGGFGFHGWLYDNIPELIRSCNIDQVKKALESDQMSISPAAKTLGLMKTH